MFTIPEPYSSKGWKAADSSLSEPRNPYGRRDMRSTNSGNSTLPLPENNYAEMTGRLVGQLHEKVGKSRTTNINTYDKGRKTKTT